MSVREWFLLLYFYFSLGILLQGQEISKMVARLGIALKSADTRLRVENHWTMTP